MRVFTIHRMTNGAKSPTVNAYTREDLAQSYCAKYSNELTTYTYEEGDGVQVGADRVTVDNRNYAIADEKRFTSIRAGALSKLTKVEIFALAISLSNLERTVFVDTAD